MCYHIQADSSCRPFPQIGASGLEKDVKRLVESISNSREKHVSFLPISGERIRPE